jgi:hypothetical protein
MNMPAGSLLRIEVKIYSKAELLLIPDQRLNASKQPAYGNGSVPLDLSPGLNRLGGILSPLYLVFLDLESDFTGSGFGLLIMGRLVSDGFRPSGLNSRSHSPICMSNL